MLGGVGGDMLGGEGDNMGGDMGGREATFLGEREATCWGEWEATCWGEWGTCTLTFTEAAFFCAGHLHIEPDMPLYKWERETKLIHFIFPFLSFSFRFFLKFRITVLRFCPFPIISFKNR